ncbi:MAG: nucleotide exchange factor GrpE [Bacteroidales bacterium]
MSIDEKDLTIEQEIELIKKKLEEQDKLSKEYLELLQRSQADFINYKNRIEKETKDVLFCETSKIFSDFLSYRETLIKAIATEKDQGFKDSLNHLLISYENILKRFGLEKLDVLNKPFDHNTSDCVLQQEVTDEKQNNLVISLIEDGYVQNKRLVKPAKVIVGIFKNNKGDKNE